MVLGESELSKTESGKKLLTTDTKENNIFIDTKIVEAEPKKQASEPVLRVIGLGGAGGNAVNRMIELGLSDVEFIVANTDKSALEKTSADKKILLGFQTATLVKPILFIVVLQLAFPRLVTDRTIQRMVGKEELQNTSPGFDHPFGFGEHLHVFLD